MRVCDPVLSRLQSGPDGPAVSGPGLLLSADVKMTWQAQHETGARRLEKLQPVVLITLQIT